jgi:Tfp pilus assembly protein PilF
MGNLAWTYMKQNQWKEATLLLEQVMRARQTRFGESDRRTLETKTNLALAYCNQGHFEQAEMLNIGIMEIRRTTNSRS